MSEHSHTHAPGEDHNHSHGPPQQQQQQQQQIPPSDPLLQALIDADFAAVPIAVNEDEPAKALCSGHKLEKCRTCGVDFINLNRLARLLAGNSSLLCPPPPQIVSKNLSQAVTTTKDEGNQYFKMNQHSNAISRYNMAASISVQRPPWENNAVMREELSAIMSNRSAAYHASGDYISALADAETVIQLRRNWPKGHFRKAKSLLGLGRFDEAGDALKLGLSFDPENNELNGFLGDIEKAGRAVRAAKVEAREAIVKAEE